MQALLTRRAAAALLGKPPSWISYAVQRGVLPFVRVGQQLRFRPEELEQWVKARAVPVRRRGRKS
jgi:excisionase family DNA binding protein